MRHAATVAELERWRDHGATWRVRELTGEEIEVELCTCSGEPVDLFRTDDPAVIAFLRAQPSTL
ncbi:MAG TPA: hypothetical protein VGG87_08520 [Solirubrobacteraceae bacterium]|jgi:hypothetical protein